MPRTQIPKLRFPAIADSPLLPFLAPRVFAEPPIFKRTKQYKEAIKRAGKEKEFKDGNSTESSSIGSQHEDATGESNRRNQVRAGTIFSNRRTGCNAKDYLLSPNPVTSRSKASGESFIRDTLDQRYADIFSIARQQTRHHSTGQASSIGKEITPSKTGRKQRQARSRRSTQSSISSGKVGRDLLFAKQRKLPAGNKRKWVDNLQTFTKGRRMRTGLFKQGRYRPTPRRRRSSATSIAAGRFSLFTKRRKRALAIVQKRLDHLLFSARGTTSNARLMKQGRYRSLIRRIMSLQQENEEIVDMEHYNQESPVIRISPRAFAALDRIAYPRWRRLTAPIKIKHDPRCDEWIRRLFYNTHPTGNGRIPLQNWTDFSEQERNTCWHHVLLRLLCHTPARAIDFIEVLGHGPHIPGLEPHILADSLEHVARRLSRDIKWASAKRKFAPLFCHIYHRNFMKHPYMCSQDLLYSIVNIADIEDLKKVFHLLVEARTYLGYDTLLHYANAFGKANEHKLALSCLDELKKRNHAGWPDIVKRTRFHWTCALILRDSMRKGRDYHVVSEIVAAFVRLGVKLDLLLYNVVMNNAMDAGDYPTAFKVYNALESNGLKPGRDTFQVLLHGCTQHSTPTVFRDFAEYCAEMAADMKSARLAAGYLYYVYVCHQDDQDMGRFSTILLHAYVRFFHVVPLKSFIGKSGKELQAVINQNGSLAKSSGLDPPSFAIYIMLQLEIRKALEEGNDRVWQLYETFRRNARSKGHPHISLLAEDPIIWNSFLLAFCKKQQFANAYQVIKHMTDYSPQPNIYSWNIFMQGFFKTGQVKAAERVFEIMRNRQIEPNQFTFGSLAYGYAKAQMLPELEDAMQHLDADQQLDSDLLRALARVTERKKLLVALENKRLEKEQKERDQASKKVEEDGHRWLPLALRPNLQSHRSKDAANEGDVTEPPVDSEPYTTPLNSATDTQQSRPSTV